MTSHGPRSHEDATFLYEELDGAQIAENHVHDDEEKRANSATKSTLMMITNTQSMEQKSRSC